MKEKITKWLIENGLSADTFNALPFGDKVSVIDAYFGGNYEEV